MRQVSPNPTKADLQTLREFAEAINQAAAGDLYPFVQATGSYSAGPSDSVIYIAPSGTCQITLPAASEVKGRMYYVKRSNNTTHTVTIAATGGNIDGAASTTLTTAYQVKRFASDGANYWSM